MALGQASLFGDEPPAFDDRFASLERIPLADGAWLDLARGWLKGERRVFDELERSTRWRAEQRRMYERTVAVPRLYAHASDAPALPVIAEMGRSLGAHYATHFERV